MTWLHGICQEENMPTSLAARIPGGSYLTMLLLLMMFGMKLLILNYMETKQSILKEADEIVNDRTRGYEPAEDSFKNISQIASAIRRKNITPRDVSAVMIALKLSREQYAHKRDNNVDAAGYIQIDHLLAEAEYE